MEYRHKQKIQHQIDHRCNGNENHGQLTFAHAPENGTDGVIPIDKHHAAAADDGIAPSVCPDCVWRVHDAEKRITEHNAQNAEYNAGNQLRGKQRANGGLKIMVLCANLLAEQNLRTKAEAHADAQKHIQQLTANSHGR